MIFGEIERNRGISIFYRCGLWKCRQKRRKSTTKKIDSSLLVEEIFSLDQKSGTASLCHIMPLWLTYLFVQHVSNSLYEIKEHTLIRILYAFNSSPWHGIVDLCETSDLVNSLFRHSRVVRVIFAPQSLRIDSIICVVRT